MNGNSTRKKPKRRPKAGRSSSIPVSLWLASFAALLMVSTATLYVISQIQQLERSTRLLLRAGVPLKESTYRLVTSIRKTEFLLHKALALSDSSYFQAIEQEIKRQKATLGDLRPLLLDAPEALQAMVLLHTNLRVYWRWIDENKHQSANAIPRSLERMVDVKIADYHISIDKLAVERAAATMKTANHVTNVLLMLVIATAIFGIVISSLYATAATRPIRNIRHALMRIGDGLFDQNLNLEGLRELRELSHAVNTMQAKLRELEQAKTEFLSLISHELKTPLASFQSGIELLRSGGIGVLPAAQRKVVEIMHKQAIQLGASIQEMLDMQAIQTQRLVMNLRPCNLSDIIKDAIERILPLTREKNQRIQWLSLLTKLEVFVDPERTRQILLNLLSNANKYSPRDTRITISAKRHRKYVYVMVEDEGPGIPEKFLGSACDRFFQVPAQGAHLRGTGLGLAIVKEMAEAQRGGVALENRKDKGLRVQVRLPLCDTGHSNKPQV